MFTNKLQTPNKKEYIFVDNYDTLKIPNFKKGIREMKKIIATILTLAMMLSLAIVATTSASAQSEPWDGMTFSETFSSGTGTEADPYIIMNGNDLNKLSVDVTGGILYAGEYFKLGDDINLGGWDWISIGTDDTTPFSGNLDGNGKTIFNFSAASNSAGLFGYMEGGSVKNLKIDYATIRNNKYSKAGALAGRTKNVTVENIEIGENVIVGNTPLSSTAQIGGVIGFCIDNSIVKNVIFRGQLDIQFGKKTSYIGAIIGLMGGESELDGAINYGKLTYKYVDPDPTVVDATFIAGIVGGVGNDALTGKIKNCVNYGAIESVSYASGVLGRVLAPNGFLLENCFNLSDSITSADNQLGLIIGYAAKSGTVTNCATLNVGDAPFCSGTKDGVTFGDNPDGMRFISSADEVSFDPAFAKIIESVPAAMPQWNTVTPDNYEAPEVTETEGTDPEVTEPEDSNPAEGTEPEGTEPEAKPTDPVQTPSTDAPGTEKPAAGTSLAGGTHFF